MPAQTANRLVAQAIELYQNQAYAEALDLLTAEGERYPEQAAMVFFLRACMATRMAAPELALEILEDAIRRGHWYSEQLINRTLSLKPLRGMPRFERAMEICKERHWEVEAVARVFTREPEGGCPAGRPCPLLVALHGNWGNAPNTLREWDSIVSRGWMLAAIQSSEVLAANAYAWEDQESALRDIEEQYAKLSTRYPIDEERLIIGGISSGGETALRVALDGTIPATGFIVLAPGGADVAALEPYTEQAQARGLRGYFLLGEEDGGVSHEAVRGLVAMLNTRKVPCKLELLPGVGHEYPPDFAAILARAIAFINKQE
ncbi:MAG TPA: dienelactone hydrolase family protein [Chloroflexia bacterium]|jgi:dienelactone hydrolase